MNILFSRNLAIVLGIITPLWKRSGDGIRGRKIRFRFFDDYVLGGLLLFGAWRVKRNARAGQKFLAAGRGFALGMAYGSFDFQLQQVRIGAIDPALISTEWVAVVKGIGLALVRV